MGAAVFKGKKIMGDFIKDHIFEWAQRIGITLTFGTAIGKILDFLPSLAIIVSISVTIIITIINIGIKRNKKKLQEKENKLLDLQIRNEELLLRKANELGLKPKRNLPKNERLKGKK